MLERPLRAALPLSAPFVLLALIAALWGTTPSVPSAPFEVRVLGPGDVPLAATVCTRCWQSPGESTEVSGSTDAEGIFRVELTDCKIVALVATAPGHLPETRRMGPPTGPVTLRLLPTPPTSSVEIRDEGWAGRDRPGARLALERASDGALRVLGWDLLGDQPAADRDGADLWLKRPDGREGLDPATWVPTPGPTSALPPRPGALPRRPWLAPIPKDMPGPALWHAWQLDQDWSDRPREASPSTWTYWLCARDNHTTALLLQDGAPRRSEGCLDGQAGCETWTWTFAALVDNSGAGRFAHGLQARPEALLRAFEGDRRTPIAALVLPEAN